MKLGEFRIEGFETQGGPALDLNLVYFRVADSEYEVGRMPNAELRVIESKLGHVAGSGLDPIGKTAIDQAIVDLLSR